MVSGTSLSVIEYPEFSVPNISVIVFAFGS